MYILTRIGFDLDKACAFGTFYNKYIKPKIVFRKLGFDTYSSEVMNLFVLDKSLMFFKKTNIAILIVL